MLDNCVILAGGKSSRMGKDKTLMPFHNEPSLTHYIHKKLSKIFQNVYISSKFNKFNPPLNVINDEISDIFSPMIALASILPKFNAPVFITTADMPFIKISSILELAKYKDEYDVVIASDDEFRHTLCGFYSPTLANKAKFLAQNNQHKIGTLIQNANIKIVNFDDKKQFFNINTPHEYESALDENF